jgi:hypothetical protein
MNQPKGPMKNAVESGAIDRDFIDHILASEDPIVPTSGFLASVMVRVQEESRVPNPIQFPWRRAIPGFLLASGVFGWGAYEFIREVVLAIRNLTFAAPHLSAATHSLEQAAWVGLALAISLASWVLSRRIAGESGLL